MKKKKFIHRWLVTYGEVPIYGNVSVHKSEKKIAGKKFRYLILTPTLIHTTIVCTPDQYRWSQLVF